MLRAADGSFSFLTESIELVSQNGAVYIRVVTQRTHINPANYGALRRVRTWELDGIETPMLAKIVALDQRRQDAISVVVNLLIPFAYPIPITIGSEREVPPDGAEAEEIEDEVEEEIEETEEEALPPKPKKKKPKQIKPIDAFLKPRKLDVDGL